MTFNKYLGTFDLWWASSKHFRSKPALQSHNLHLCNKTVGQQHKKSNKSRRTFNSINPAIVGNVGSNNQVSEFTEFKKSLLD